MYTILIYFDYTNTCNILEMINVLCLHGCCQSADDFSKHLKDFIKISRSAKIKLFFLDAPFKHPIRGKTWVIRDDTQSDEYLPDFSDTSKYQLSMDIIIEHIVRNDITCLLGFSEGACMIDTLLRVNHPSMSQITRYVLMNGTSFTNVPTTITSQNIHIMSIVSENDTIVKISDKPTYDSSINEIVLHHDRGHNIPRTKEQRIIIGFICGFDNVTPFYIH